MAVCLTIDNKFSVSGDVIYNLLQLQKAVEKEDIASIMLISGKLAQYMNTYDIHKSYLSKSNEKD